MAIGETYIFHGENDGECDELIGICLPAILQELGKSLLCDSMKLLDTFQFSWIRTVVVKIDTCQAQYGRQYGSIPLHTRKTVLPVVCPFQDASPLTPTVDDWEDGRLAYHAASKTSRKARDQ
jgi:hypothetical protein